MSSTCMVIPMPTPSKTCRRLAVLLVMMLSSAWTAGASAATPWHPDLATACRASEVSQRPVLAIFTASWSTASTTLDRTTLASDEAVALITACFEPVCVDVDANPEATRRLGITKIPTACILTANEQPLTKFELPETPAGFVAAAARAAQESALASATRATSQTATTEPSGSLRELADVAASGSALPSFGGGKGPRVTTTTDLRGTVPPGGKAVNAVAAKVRMLSDFACDDGVPASGPESAIAASFRENDPPLAATPPSSPALMAPMAPPTATAAASQTPAMAQPSFAPIEPAQAMAPSTTITPTASTTPATSPTGGALASTTAQTPLSIEPGPSAVSNTTAQSAPWLGLPQQNQTAAPAPAGPPVATPRTETIANGRPTGAPQSPPDAKPPVSAQPAPSGAATALAETKPKKPTVTSSMLSALQKPFSLFSKPQAAKPAPGSTSTAANAAAQTAPDPVTPPEPDAYGSMPVGLEGYCPVTLAERGVWVEGRAQWGVRHRGRTYLFASAEQQKAFLADPDRYSPALSGDDPVLAFDTGKSTPGQRRYGVTYQSRTYLFSSTETRDAFAANPQRYTAGAVVAENRAPASGPVVR
jgi:YHS domain-containing protein